MKEKDMTEKVFLAYEDVFADIINTTYFNGKEVVKADELKDTSEISQYKDKVGKHHEQIRDIAKVWEKEGIIFSFIGIENQTKPDKDMILRVLSYDAATYKKQSGKERIYPVITIVLYWGKMRWKEPKSLKERLDFPETIEKLISDYSYQLIEVGRLTDEEISRYQSDFRFVAEFIAEKENYKPSTKEIKHPEELMDLLFALKNDERFMLVKNQLKEIREEGRPITMCKILDKYWNSGIELGREEGREEGKEFATLLIAKNLKENDVSISIIMKTTGLNEEEIRKL